jgi:hypothetical protein
MKSARSSRVEKNWTRKLPLANWVVLGLGEKLGHA